MGSGWIGVDLDGTLAKYYGWQGAHHIGPPIPKMMERVRGWIDRGIEVRIMTARAAPGPGSVDEALKVISAWLVQHLGHTLPITYEKDHALMELWDDRAVQVEPNTGVALQEVLSRALAERDLWKTRAHDRES